MKPVEKIGGIALIPVENIQDAILRVGKKLEGSCGKRTGV
mgnify:CR=1 FL=1